MYIVLQNEYAIQVNKEIGYDWMDGEEMVGSLFKILLLFVSFIVILFSIWSTDLKMILHTLVQPGCSAWPKDEASESNICLAVGE